jgi:hypothetical protein
MKLSVRGDWPISYDSTRKYTEVLCPIIDFLVASHVRCCGEVGPQSDLNVELRPTRAGVRSLLDNGRWSVGRADGG